MIDITVEIEGNIADAVQGAFANMRTEFVGPLVEEAEEIRAASMEIVPVDDGILRNSALEVGINPSNEDDGVYVRFGYGGAARSYALVQHETPPEVFRHAEGKSWKYLERPVYEAANTMGQRIAQRLASRFRGGVSSGDTFGGS